MTQAQRKVATLPSVPLHAWVWCDGSVQPAEEVRVCGLDRALLWGLGAFETLRLHGGKPFLAARHVERLGRSLKAMGLPLPPSAAALPAGLEDLAAKLGVRSALCRITVTGGVGAEHADLPNSGMRVIAHLRALPKAEAGRMRVGIAVGLHDPTSPLAGVKSTSYLGHYLQREAAERAGRVDDLVLDPRGDVAEGTVSSLFGVRAGVLVTPALSAAILAGVTRDVVLDLARAAGLTIEERRVPRTELAELDECFLTGAGKILVSVDELDGRSMPLARPVTRRLHDAMAVRIARECSVRPEEIAF
ncbi:MAG: aminotransferase class IV [Planctomycetota bacterium]